MFNIFLFLILWSFIDVKCQTDPIVTVEQGQVRGTVSSTLSGRTYYQFRGIPYAQPPVEDLRFQPPLPANAWSGVFNATRDYPPCIQLLIGQEDCLALNVYTPKLADNETSFFPVMLFIHGGAFSSGQPSSYVFGPQYFMEKNVVLVMIAYRLGAFGFLSTGDGAASGNYGLLDQSLALKWVHDNIAAFNGDPNSVVIFGESAGAASVSYQILSPVSAGLFRGAITESGSALHTWAIQTDPLPWAIALANKFECPVDDNALLVDCLRGQRAVDIVAKSAELGEYDVMTTSFLPVIEDPEYGQFITEQPIDILQNGNFNKVPIISGINKDEGDLTYGSTQQYYTTIDDKFYDVTLPLLIASITNYKTNLVNVSYAVKAEYFDKIDVNNDTQVTRTAIDMNSDCAFKSENDMWVRKMAAQGLPTYMYVFEYAGFASHHNYSGEIEVSHGDELYYIFYVGTTLEGDDLRVSNDIIDMWTNFATQLNPNPVQENVTWNQTSVGSIQYLRISDDLSMQDGYRTEQMDFWNNIVPEIVYG